MAQLLLLTVFLRTLDSSTQPSTKVVTYLRKKLKTKVKVTKKKRPMTKKRR